MNLKPINQQVVVVVGASSGIGRATALRFAEQGASVVVAARNEKGLATLVREIREKKGKAAMIVADVADAEQVKRVADKAIEEFGRIDTWAHIAGVGYYAPFSLSRPEEMERVIEVNLLGQMYGARAALPHLVAQGKGALIHVSSVEGTVPYPLSSVYSASKHGMVGFLGALRMELERQGASIAVVEIRPGATNTPFFANAMTRLGVAPRPPRPMYSPEVVARAIVAAASAPPREIVVGGLPLGFTLLQRISPRLVSEIMLTKLGFEVQLSRIAKSPDGPSNLFTPTPDEHLAIHGEYGKDEIRTSPTTALMTSGPARMAVELTRPLRRLFAKAVAVLWSIRYGKGVKGLGGPGAGLPAPVAREVAREEKGLPSRPGKRPRGKHAAT